MNIPFFQIDAFAERPFEGNPAAVCLLETDLADVASEGGRKDTLWAQNVAAEMNLSETAFVGPRAADGSRQLRWFTPEVEVDLCGHATLAAAHALWSSDGAPAGEDIVFATRSGALRAAPLGDELGAAIQLDFPARPAVRCAPPDELLVALGITPRAVGKSSENDFLVELESVSFVAGIQPDFHLLATVAGRGFIVTAMVKPHDDVPSHKSGARPDFVSRFFAPSCGVDEDPVTGSAHCSLAPYWCQRLKRDNLLGYQDSRRGGFVGVETVADRVKLNGGAVTVLEGTLQAARPSW